MSTSLSIALAADDSVLELVRDDGSGLQIRAGGHWVPEMISIAGGEDVAGPPGLKSPEVGWGALAALNPDVVVSMPCGWYVEQARAQTLEHWERVEALRAERVFAVDAASTFSRPGTRLIDGVELLGHLLHPDLLDPPLDRSFKKPGGYVMRDKLAAARARAGTEKPAARSEGHDRTGGHRSKGPS